MNFTYLRSVASLFSCLIGIVFSFNVFAAGITIPANCTIDVNGCSLVVSGDMNNSGTLRGGTGSITVSGDWLSSGSFVSGTGTVTFNAAGAQTLNTGGLANAFYNLSHTGAGTAQVITNLVDINNSFSNSAGTFNANGINITVAKDWTNSAAFTPGTGTVTFDGTTQTIAGTTTFYDLTKVTAAADTLTFSANGTDETSATHHLTLHGALGSLLTLEKSGANSQAKLNLNPGGIQTLSYLNVHNNNASGVMLVAGATSTDAGNNTNWNFGNATITWTGTVSVDWDDPFNWNLGLVPGPGDTVVIAPIGGTIVYQPTLSTNVVIGNLTIQASAVLTLNGKNLTVSTTFANSGNLKLNGNETLNITQDVVNPGAFTYVGTGTGIVITIKDYGATDYYSLVINDTHGTLDTFVTNNNLTLAGNLNVTGSTMNISTNSNALTVAGTLTVDGGTLTATSGTIDANGAVAVSSGVLTAPSSTANTAFTVFGNFTHSGGTFTNSSGKVTLDGTNQTMTGSTTFYQLRKVVAAAATLTLGASDTQTVTNNLTLNGASGQLLSLRSSSTPTQANLNLQAGGTQSISLVDVKDNHATGLLLVAGGASVDSGNNTNWSFGGTTMTWTGATSTDWDVPTNWDIGVVPGIADVAVIANVGNQPATLSTNVQLTTLTLNSGATVASNGKNLVVSGVLTNNGTITRFGNETMTFGTMDSAHGTFIYTGNGDVTQDTFIVTATSASYFNLTINDTNATPANRDIFRTNAALTVNGALTVSGGTLDTSTNANALVAAGALTVSGGILTATGGTIDANSSVTISSGTFTAPSSTTNTGFTVAGNFAHSGGTFSHSNGKVTFDGTGQSITGNSTFYKFRKVVAAADTLTFGAAETQTIVSDLTMDGATGQLLSLRSNSSPTKAKLTLQTGGTQDINYVDVKDNDASGGLFLAARTGSVDSGNTIHWLFGAAVLNWTGATSTDWDTPTNWDLGFTPSAPDTVFITDTSGTTTFQPILATNATVANLTLQANTNLHSNGLNLTVTDTVSNDGIVYLKGSETVEIKTQDINSGTFTYLGTGAAGPYTLKITDPTTHLTLTNEFYNLTINDSSNAATFLRAADLNVQGTLSISGGNLTVTNFNLDVNGSVALSGNGTLVAPTTGKSFTVAGDFSHAAGSTFTNSSGKVLFDTAATALITGDTTFYDLFSLTAGKQFTFTAGSNQTVTHTFNFVGTRASKIILRSSVAATKWSITVPNGAQFVSALDVKDSDALTNDITCLNCTDAGNNNSHWKFTNLSITAPDHQRTVGQTPVIIGLAPASTEVRIKGKDETGTEVIVATTTADANGNFRVVLGHDDDTDGTTTVTAGVKLKLSTVNFDNYLTPYILNGVTELPGLQNDLTVVAAPTTSQVPTITSPANNQRSSTVMPTIVGVGLASQAVSIIASDQAGNLLLTTAGTGTTDASGNYSITLTTALVANANYVSVVINGVSSDLLTINLVDPFGYVFDSSSNQVIRNATVSLYRAADNQLAEKSICDTNGNITTLKDIACDDINPFTTAADGFYSFLAKPGNYYMKVSATGYDYPSHLIVFPAGRTVSTGSKGEQFTVGATVFQLDHPVDANGFLLRIEKDANKKEAMIGDVVTYTVSIMNLSSDNAVNNVLLEDKIPPGFKYLSNRVLLDGNPIANPSGNRPLVFDIGTVNAGATRTLRYQLIVGSGVVPGTYDNSAKARYSNGVIISNFATKSVKVVIDPLFDLGSVVGKVFYDYNENGAQDAPEYDSTEGTTIVEKPVPNVQIVMEDGTIITTDQEGKFSVPGILPGRHILRVDERTLPPGTFLTTDKAVIVDVTQGSMVKVNFGINVDNTQVVGKDAQFFNEKIALTQDRNQPAARLNSALFTPARASFVAVPVPGAPAAAAAPASGPNTEELAMFNGTLVRQAEFRIFANYTPFIDLWRLDIIDSDTKKLVKRFEGNRFSIHDPIFWNGRGDDDKIVRSDRKYSYILYAFDAAKRRDATHEKPLPIRVIETEDEYKKEKQNDTDKEVLKARAEDYRKWVDTQSAVNNMDRADIPIKGETVRISRQGQDIKSVRLLKEGALFAEVPVEQYYGLTPQQVMTSGISAQEQPDNIEVIVPDGDYTLDVVGSGAGAGLTPGGQGLPPGSSPGVIPSVGAPGALPPGSGLDHFSRPLKVGDDYLMFVAMGDGQVGYTFNRGDIEAVAPDDKYKNGFWHEGKVAYYLKGKIKGKYLVTSSFDLDRKQKELFRHLDPSTYYPIYGDKSSINYDATNTQGPLYLLVQWDKSSAIWGNYAIDFNDTEFAAFTRSYYGGKLDYQSVASNPYGDARTKLVVFHAEVQQLPDHNEFLGTGGSLYFLKNRGVIQGSDKFRIEVRDRITGLVLATKEMKNGADYELDEKQGRILFWQPVSMIAKSESIVTTETLLDGNPVYVVADYQYDVKDKLAQSSQGVRVAQGIGNNVVLGGTYVNETQETSNNYTLQGTDLTAHMGPDATVKAEYAQTQSAGSGTYASTDGGITFFQLQSGSAQRGKAYGIKEDARLFNRLGLSSYYKWTSDSFNSAQTSAQQGKETAGMKLTFDLTPVTRITASQDIQRLINNGNLQTQAQVGASETSTTLMQIVHESERLKLTGAYQINQVTNRLGDIVTSTNQVSRTLAGRADYALNGRVTLTLGQQFDVVNPDNNITTLGAQVRLFDQLMVQAQESLSRNGTATTLGTTYNLTDRLAVTTAYTLAMYNTGQVDKTISIGAQENFTKNISTTGTVAVTESSTGVQTTSTTLATKALVGKSSSVEGVVGKSTASDGSQRTTASLAANTQVKDITMQSAITLGSDGKSTTATKSLSLDAAHKIDESTTAHATAGVSDDGISRTQTAGLSTTQKVDEKTERASDVKVTEDTLGNKTSTVAFTNKTKINNELQAVGEQSYGSTNDGTKIDTKYGLVREVDGRKMEGDVTRSLGDSKTAGISQSNIFGLSGDVNDKLALQGSLAKGTIQNLDGTRTSRTTITGGAGYIWKDPETAMERLKDSLKVELRMDTEAHAAQQFVFYNSIEGKVTDNLSLTAKLDYSKTWSTESNQVLERHREIILGAAYRPVNFDNLNLIARYTAQAGQGPTGQLSPAATDVEQTRSQVLAAEAVYDFNENWQLAEKIAYRINDEKVTGFDFNRTHTWLMIHRINYRVDRNWTVSGEYRKLTQVEAHDSKSGFLLEATRNINDNAQLGLGWNFTQFNDDLTNLSFTAQGPFVRMTGKLYDRSPEERARARAKWLDERVSEWAWKMVRKELSKPDSKVAADLNRMFTQARMAQKSGQYTQAQEIYKDVIMAGQMMFDEASEYVRHQIAYEQKLQDYNKNALDYFNNGEYIKARKLWEKIVDDAQKRVIQ